MDDAWRTELSWSGWGDPEQATELPEGIAELLRSGLGVIAPTPVPSSISWLELSPIRLAPDTASALVSIVGADHGRFDHETRARHALGRSLLDLLALRSVRTIAAPDLVLFPGSHDEVQAVLELCCEHRVAVVPFGGGTSVVGGLSPEAGAFEGVVAIDLRRLISCVALDRESRIAMLEPGPARPRGRGAAGQRGYTIGHFPQSFEYATLGGFAAARSSGQASAGYGRFDELVLALRVATPVGTLELGRAPKSAAGPDLRQLILGSEGAFGVITALTVQVRPAPERRVYEGWRFADFAGRDRRVRALAQDGPVPTVLRLSDEPETALSLARPTELGSAAGRSGCLAIVGYEGSLDEVRRRRELGAAILREAGADPGRGRRRGLGARSLPRAVPARRAARRRGARRNAGDGLLLVLAARRCTRPSAAPCEMR